MSTSLPWQLWVFTASFMAAGALILFSGRIDIGGESDKVLFQILGRRARVIGLMLVLAGVTLLWSVVIGLVLFLAAIVLALILRRDE
jgi:hypothetical protein